MQLETFHGSELRSVMRAVARALGSDALILDSRVVKDPLGADVVEVLATRPDELEAFRKRIEGADPAGPRNPLGPRVVALVGPAGAGKTTTAVKLVLHPEAFGGHPSGLLTLDTHRVGAVGELQTYAEIVDLPLGIAYHRREVGAALRTLRGVDTVVVDTPGRPPDASPASGWTDALAALEPDEVHLVLPAGLRPAVAASCRRRFEEVGVTHAIFTRLDEVPADRALVELAEAVDLPARWVSAGHDVPGALGAASPRILGALGAGVRHRPAVARAG